MSQRPGVMAGERLLWINAPHFCAGAVWQRLEGQWQCVHAAPIIRWAIGKPAAEVKAYLTRKRWGYEWITPAKEQN